MRRFFGILLRRILLIIFLVFALLILFRVRYNKTIRSLAQTQVINSTSDLINDAIDEQIETGNIQ